MIQDRKSDLEKKWNNDFNKIKERGKEKADVVFLMEFIQKNLSDTQQEAIFDFIDSLQYNKRWKSLSWKIEKIVEKFWLPTQEELHNSIIDKED